MAKQVNKVASIVYGGQLLEPSTNKFELMSQAATVDVSTLDTDGWRSCLQGLRDTEWSFEGFVQNDAVTHEPDSTLFSDFNTGTPFAVTVSLDRPIVAGSIVFFQWIHETSVSRGITVGEAYSFSLKMKPDSPAPAIFGRCVENVSGANADGSSAAYDLVDAVGAGQRLFVAVHVLAATGTTPTLDLIVESDTAGFASPTTRLTIPQFTGRGSYVGYVDGPITDTLYRVTRTLGGTTPSFDYVVSIGITDK